MGDAECVRCGYALRIAAAACCPECGFPTDHCDRCGAARRDGVCASCGWDARLTEWQLCGPLFAVRSRFCFAAYVSPPREGAARLGRMLWARAVIALFAACAFATGGVHYRWHAVGFDAQGDACWSWRANMLVTHWGCVGANSGFADCGTSAYYVRGVSRRLSAGASPPEAAYTAMHEESWSLVPPRLSLLVRLFAISLLPGAVSEFFLRVVPGVAELGLCRAGARLPFVRNFRRRRATLVPIAVIGQAGLIAGCAIYDQCAVMAGHPALGASVIGVELATPLIVIELMFLRAVSCDVSGEFIERRSAACKHAWCGIIVLLVVAILSTAVLAGTA